MTSPTSITANDPHPPSRDDLRVVRLLSRGSGSEAQVLLVLVSAPAPQVEGEDVWVAIGRNAPVPVFADRGWKGIEPARKLSTEELRALDLAWKPNPDGLTPFAVAVEPDRGVWLARFDFSDHPYVLNWWLWLIQAPAAETDQTIEVTAWRSRVARAPDENGITQNVFEPLPGHVVAKVGYADVVAQPPFELGVLFVHGIGDHAVRETLVHWAEPIVKFWRDRALAISHTARRALDAGTRERVARWVETHQLRNRESLDGIHEVVGQLADPPPQPGFDRPPRDREAAPMLGVPAAVAPFPCCVTAAPEQTLFPDLAPGQPSATLLRLSSVDTSATLRESHVLFAEAAWAQEAFPPTTWELYTWLTEAVPIAVWSRLQRLVSTRPKELLKQLRTGGSTFDQIRVVVSTLIWVMRVLVMPASYVAMGLASQLAIALIGAVGLVPIPWVQRATRRVITALLGTLGQSYALQTSSIRRSAIVSAVRNNLEWLTNRCHRVVVLSHSQGAEISRLAYLDGRRDKIEHWYTFGSGISPLNMLHPKSLAEKNSRMVVRFSKGVLAVSALLLAGLALESMPGVDTGLGQYTRRATQALSWFSVLVAYTVFMVMIVLGSQAGPAVRPVLRRSLMRRWTDIYASEDPVPGGSLIDRFEHDFAALAPDVPTQSRIFNTRFAILDHTTYWGNVEQFVAPIALDLLRFAGLGADPASERGALEKAARRRDLRTWWNMIVTTLALGGAAGAFAWVAVGPAARGQVWAAQAGAVWAQNGSLVKSLAHGWSDGTVGRVVSDLRLSFAILAALGAWWAGSWTLGRRSSKALVTALAAASRRP